MTNSNTIPVREQYPIFCFLPTPSKIIMLLRYIGTFSGETTLSFLFLPPFSKGGQLLKERIAPLGAILSFTNRPNFCRTALFREGLKVVPLGWLFGA